MGVAIDKTGSADPNGIGPPSVEDFSTLLDLLGTFGGELGVGVIRETSNRPLLRVRIPPPPPAKIVKSTNIYVMREGGPAQTREDDKRKAGIQQQVEIFKRSLSSVLDQPEDAKKSAICEAVQRVDLFLREDDRSEVARFAVFITDGEENVASSPCPPLRANARVLIVRGAKEAPAFQEMEALHFESVSAAFSWIAANPRR